MDAEFTTCIADCYVILEVNYDVIQYNLDFQRFISNKVFESYMYIEYLYSDDLLLTYLYQL